MYTEMEMWNDIRRRVLVDKESKRSVQRRYGVHWKTLEKILDHSEPPGYRMSKSRHKPKIAAFLPVIEAIIESDKIAPRKQRHTAKRIFERLRSEWGFTGGYTIVKEAVGELILRQKEVFIPLSHKPGEAQVDFGCVHVKDGGELRKAAMFVMSLPYSGAIFVQVYPRECQEAFQEGHKRAFEYFGGVPDRISYDNLKIAVIKVLGGRERELSRDFLRLRSHYLFKSHFCRVARPNEKGNVENLLGYARRNFLVPVPELNSYRELNKNLAERCSEELNRRVRGKSDCKSGLFEDDKSAMLPLPKGSYEARRVVQTSANSLSLVRFDGNDYSVPSENAYHDVTGVGGMDEVRFIVNNAVVARHVRCWEKEKVFFEPVHYLAVLERKPGALDVALPLSGWELPECFHILRRRLESDQNSGGTREYIKVLRLMEKYSLREIEKAVERGLEIGATSVEAIRLIAEHGREGEAEIFSLDGRPHLKAVTVDRINLCSYGELVSQAEVCSS